MRISNSRRPAWALVSALMFAACSNPTPLAPTAPALIGTPVSVRTPVPAAPTAAGVTPSSATPPPAKPLTSPIPTPTVPVVSVRGKLAFSSDESGVFQIYVTSFPGGVVKAITASPNPGDAEARWSPDGAFFVFNSGRVAVEGYGIYRMNADGSGQTRLIALPAKRSLNFSPQISPDGTKLIFHTNRDGNFEIYSANVDGSGLKNLTNDPGNDVNPAWSRAGDLITWSANRIGDGYQLYVAKSDGSNPRQILSQPSSNTARPAFSPDGKRIAFTIQSFVSTPAKIALIGVEGSGFRVLDLGPGEFLMGDWIDDDTLVYSWRQGDSEKYKIVTSRLDGTNRQVLVSVAGDALYPAWTK